MKTARKSVTRSAGYTLRAQERRRTANPSTGASNEGRGYGKGKAQKKLKLITIPNAQNLRVVTEESLRRLVEILREDLLELRRRVLKGPPPTYASLETSRSEAAATDPCWLCEVTYVEEGRILMRCETWCCDGGSSSEICCPATQKSCGGE